MGSTNEEVLFPKSLTLPTIPKADQTATGPKAGMIGISGVKLLFYTGSAWEVITSTAC